MNKIYILLLLILISGCGPKIYDPPLEFYTKPEFKDCSQVKERNCELQNLILSYDFDYNKGDMSVTEGSYYLIDMNRDDSYDLLLIKINVESNVDDDYVFYMNLKEENDIISSKREQKIKKGNNTVKFDFKTSLLKSKAYTVGLRIETKEKLSIFYDIGLFSLDINATVEFEAPPFTVDVVSHKYLNTDDDPEYESLQINTVFDIKKVGMYVTKAWINGEKMSGTSLVYAMGILFIEGEKGKHEIPFYFDLSNITEQHWKKIVLWQIETTYEDVKYENYFNYTIDFDVGKAEKGTTITGPYSEETTDDDNDELIDSLVINADVYVAEKGDYTIQADLLDMYKNRVQFIEKEISLNKGQQTVQIEFSGTKIYPKKINGPYEVRYIKILKEGNEIDSVSSPITTKMYYYDDFERHEMPDLTISELKIVGNDVIAKIGNTGNVDAFAVSLSFYDQDFEEIEKIIIPTISSDGVSEKKIKLPDKKPSKIYAVVDFDNEIEEIEETNNQMQIMPP